MESTYEACLTFELIEQGLRVERQKELPVLYRGVLIDCGYRIDLLVEDVVIVEIKSVEKIESIHQAQLLTYLRLADKRVGLLMNFNVRVLTRGLKRMVNELEQQSPRSLRSLR